MGVGIRTRDLRKIGGFRAGKKAKKGPTPQVTALDRVSIEGTPVALFSAAGGLTLGCSGQTHIGLMFNLVLAPMIMFGCAYYLWSALASFPILQKLVRINPPVYASEGPRGTLVPQYPHMSPVVIIIVLGLMDGALLFAGLHRFRSKAVS
jgi:ABC-2 type transport system permease protein